ncbi:MAG: TlpA disulfide reductase family protein [Pseudomonadota bacterium]
MTRVGRAATIGALTAILSVAQWPVLDFRCQDVLAAMGGTRFQTFEKPPMAQDFPMGSLDGHVFSLSDLKGKVVLLNFWRKNCPFCLREKEHLEGMVRSLNRSDLEVICINLWDNPSWIQRRYGRKDTPNMRYATKSDGGRWVVENKVGGRLMGYYVVNEDNEAIYEVKGFPSTYVVDKTGRVVASHTGMVDWTSPVVRNWLLRALGPRPRGDGVQTAEYRPPEWLNRLLASDVNPNRRLEGVPTRRAQLMTPRSGLVSEERSGRVADSNRW